jgi:hypothetical protein
MPLSNHPDASKAATGLITFMAYMEMVATREGGEELSAYLDNMLTRTGEASQRKLITAAIEYVKEEME